MRWDLNRRILRRKDREREQNADIVNVALFNSLSVLFQKEPSWHRARLGRLAPRKTAFETVQACSWLLIIRNFRHSVGAVGKNNPMLNEVGERE